MNIMEQTAGTFRVKITGLSIRQIKDIFEDKWGALMWANGAAYPTDSVTLQFTNPVTVQGIDVTSLHQAAKRLSARGFFDAVTCADTDTLADMAYMRKALADIEARDKLFMKPWGLQA